MDGSFRGGQRRINEFERGAVARHFLSALGNDIIAVIGQFLDQANVVIKHVARGFSDINGASMRPRFWFRVRHAAQLFRPVAQEREKLAEHRPVQIFDRLSANEEFLDLTQTRAIGLLIETVSLGMPHSFRPILEIDVVLATITMCSSTSSPRRFWHSRKYSNSLRQYSLAIQFSERITSSNADLSSSD